MVVLGKNLQLLRDALVRAINDVQTEIGSHPAPLACAAEIDELEDEQAKYEAMLARIDKTIAKEAGRK